MQVYKDMRIRRICYAAIFILSLVVISRYGGAVSYSIFFAVAMIPLLSLVYLFYVFLRFRVYQEIQTRNLIADQAVPYSFIIKNEGFTVFTSVAVKIYADFSFVEKVPDNQKFRLFPGEKYTFYTRLNCKYRGEYKVGVSHVIISDYFELFRFTYQMPSVIEALVKPRIVSLGGLNSIPELEEYIQSQMALEKNETDVTVREYIQGDSLKKIHWKATAKSGSLKVRNEIGTLKQKMIILADFERIYSDIRIYLPVENKILEITIALLYFFSLQNIRMDLLWKAEKIEKRSMFGGNSFGGIYEELSALYFQKKAEFALFFQEIRQADLLVSGTILFFVIQKIDNSLFTELSRLSSAGKIVIVYVVTAEDISEYVRQSSVRMKITAISPEEEIEGKL